MRKLSIISALVLLLAMLLVVGVDNWRFRSITARVRTLRVGDSKQQVEQLLGRPLGTFTPLPGAGTNFLAALLSVPSETWAYGSRLELRRPFYAEFPYFFPVRLRLFQPDSDDVCIEFDSSGRVSKITIP